jgi:hypothetical protein
MNWQGVSDARSFIALAKFVVYLSPGLGLRLYGEVSNKQPRPEQPLIFKTLVDVKAFVSEYFGASRGWP